MINLFSLGTTNPQLHTAVTATAKTVPKSPSFWNQYLSHFRWDVILSNATKEIAWIIFVSIIFLLFANVGRAIIRKFFKVRQAKAEKKGKDVTKLTGVPVSVAIKRNKTMASLTGNIYYYVVIFFWIYSILSILGIPVGTLLAGAGIFSVAIGLGAQGFLSDIVSGFFIITEHQIDVGETVVINNIEGTVAAVGLRTTQIRSSDGTLNFIPNRNIETIANMSRGEMQTTINLDISPESPIKKIESVINGVNQQYCPSDENVKYEPVIAGPTHLSDGSLVIQVLIKTTSGAQKQVQSKYLGLYLTALQKAGIKLPPTPLIVTSQQS